MTGAAIDQHTGRQVCRRQVDECREVRADAHVDRTDEPARPCQIVVTVTAAIAAGNRSARNGGNVVVRTVENASADLPARHREGVGAGLAIVVAALDQSSRNRSLIVSFPAKIPPPWIVPPSMNNWSSPVPVLTSPFIVPPARFVTMSTPGPRLTVPPWGWPLD